MGARYHVQGIKPADEKFIAMRKIRDACLEWGVDPPLAGEVSFDGKDQNEKGVVVDLQHLECCERYVKSVDIEKFDLQGIEVDLRKLPEDVKILRFFVEY